MLSNTQTCGDNDEYEKKRARWPNNYSGERQAQIFTKDRRIVNSADNSDGHQHTANPSQNPNGNSHLGPPQNHYWSTGSPIHETFYSLSIFGRVQFESTVAVRPRILRFSPMVKFLLNVNRRPQRRFFVRRRRAKRRESPTRRFPRSEALLGPRRPQQEIN